MMGLVESDTVQLDHPASSDGLGADPHAEAQVVAKAALRAAAILDIAPATLGKILGLSKSGQARLADGTFELALFGAPFVRAVQFVRVFTALDTITGGDEQAARSWLRTRTFAPRDTPMELMKTPRGLAQVALHLEGQVTPKLCSSAICGAATPAATFEAPEPWPLRRLRALHRKWPGDRRGPGT